mgnify:CR=1 FL=1
MIFVTGATGLLGSHLLVELLKRGKNVRALKRSSSDLSHVKAIFNHFFQEDSETHFDKIEWIEGDILDITSLETGIAGCDIVYHCAGLVSFRKKDFKRLMKINKEGTANVVNVSLNHKVKQFCHVSSTAAIGRSGTKEIYDESSKWVNSSDNSNYAISKYSAENEVWRGKEEGLDVVIINPSVILGVGDWNESSLSLFKVVKNGLKFFTPGTNAFVDARDVAFVFCELSERAIVNERFLVISENVPFKTLFRKIADEFGVKGPTIEVKKWMTGIAWRIEGILAALFGKKQNITKETARSSMMTTIYSNEKIKSALAFDFISIDQSVKDSVAYFKELDK